MYHQNIGTTYYLLIIFHKQNTPPHRRHGPGEHRATAQSRGEVTVTRAPAQLQTFLVREAQLNRHLEHQNILPI
jgi:hypothetical protein